MNCILCLCQKHNMYDFICGLINRRKCQAALTSWQWICLCLPYFLCKTPAGDESRQKHQGGIQGFIIAVSLMIKEAFLYHLVPDHAAEHLSACLSTFNCIIQVSLILDSLSVQLCFPPFLITVTTTFLQRKPVKLRAF